MNFHGSMHAIAVLIMSCMHVYSHVWTFRVVLTEAGFFSDIYNFLYIPLNMLDQYVLFSFGVQGAFEGTSLSTTA